MKLTFSMAFAPIRIKRVTRQVSKSDLHWHEKVMYQILMAYNPENVDIQESMALFLDNQLVKYEKYTYALRCRYFNDGSPTANGCTVGLSSKLSCLDFGGNTCNSCSFEQAITRWEIRVMDLKKECNTKDEKVQRIEDAEMAFSDCADIICERKFQVILIKNMKISKILKII